MVKTLEMFEFGLWATSEAGKAPPHDEVEQLCEVGR